MPAPVFTEQGNEEWRTAPLCPDYEVSSGGNVRRRTAACGTWPGRPIKPNPLRGGYLVIRANLRGAVRFYTVHRLVASAFLGPCPEGFEVSHENHNPGDNRPENLRWRSHRDNARLSREAGRYAAGSRHPSSKVNDEAAKVLIHFAGKIPRPRFLMERLAALHRVSSITVRNVIRRAQK